MDGWMDGWQWIEWDDDGWFKRLTDSLLFECKLTVYAVDDKDEKSNVLLPGMVEAISRDLIRYWLGRDTFFSRFDQGIMLDGQGLFSVTLEDIARNQATCCANVGCGHGGTIIDPFMGVDGNAI